MNIESYEKTETVSCRKVAFTQYIIHTVTIVTSGAPMNLPAIYSISIALDQWKYNKPIPEARFFEIPCLSHKKAICEALIVTGEWYIMNKNDFSYMCLIQSLLKWIDILYPTDSLPLELILLDQQKMLIQIIVYEAKGYNLRNNYLNERGIEFVASMMERLGHLDSIEREYTDLKRIDKNFIKDIEYFPKEKKNRLFTAFRQVGFWYLEEKVPNTFYIKAYEILKIWINNLYP